MRTMFKMVTLVALAAPVFSAEVAFAQVRTFKVGAPSQIQFVSDAPLERISGVSSGLHGEVIVDPNAPQTAKANLKVDTAALKTGLDLRDEHLRSEKWLDAGRFPTSTFVITKVAGLDKLKPNELAEPTVTGKFTMHGVTREVTTKAKVRFTPAAGSVKNDAMRVQASFTVHLEDYRVSIPSIVALKVSPDIQINIDMHATAEPAAAAPVPETKTNAPSANETPKAEPEKQEAVAPGKKKPRKAGKGGKTPSGKKATSGGSPAKPAPAAKPHGS